MGSLVPLGAATAVCGCPATGAYLTLQSTSVGPGITQVDHPEKAPVMMSGRAAVRRCRRDTDCDFGVRRVRVLPKRLRGKRSKKLQGQNWMKLARSPGQL